MKVWYDQDVLLGCICILPFPPKGVFLPFIGSLQHVRTRIGDGAVVGTRATLLPGSTIEEGGEVGACSLIMKGEHVSAHTFWFGLPAGPVSKYSGL